MAVSGKQIARYAMAAWQLVTGSLLRIPRRPLHPLRRGERSFSVVLVYRLLCDRESSRDRKYKKVQSQESRRTTYGLIWSVGEMCDD